MAALSRTIRAGRAFVELFADDTKLVVGLKSAQAKLLAFGKSIRGIGVTLSTIAGALASPFALALKSFDDAAGALGDMNIRTGLAVETLSQLRVAADLSGSSIEEVEKAVRTFQRTISEAAAREQEATKKLRELGLAAKDLAGLSVEKQFLAAASALDKFSNINDKVRVGLAVFGKTFASLMPLIAGGAEGISKLRAQLDALGLTITDAEAKLGDEFGDNVILVTAQLERLGVAVSAAIAPALRELFGWFLKVGAAAIRWVQGNQQIVVLAAKIAVAVTGLGGAFLALGIALGVLGKTFGVFIGVFTTALVPLRLMFTLIGALLNPIGLLITAVGVLTAALVGFSDIGSAVLAWLGRQFGALASTALESLKAIHDAIASGDIAAAANVLWTQLKLIWATGRNALLKIWLTIRNGMIGVVVNLWHEVVSAFEIGVSTLHSLWLQLVVGMKELWFAVADTIRSIWGGVEKFLTKSWNRLKGLFDSTFDVQKANDAAEALFESEKVGRDKRRQEQVQKLKEELAADLAKIQEDHEAKLARIGQDNLAIHRDLDEDFVEEVNDSNRALADARAKWEEALNAVAERKADAGASDGELDLAGRLKAFLADIEDFVSGVKETAVADVAGGFTNVELLGQQGGTTQDRIASATEQTAKGVEDVRRELKSFRPVFA